MRATTRQTTECQIILFPRPSGRRNVPEPQESELVRLINETTDLVRRNGGRLFFDQPPVASALPKRPPLFLVPLFGPCAGNEA